MSVKVKICGITHKDDALAAVDAGADALGFMFYELSPRYLLLKAARTIILRVPPFITKVGVFVDPSEETVRRAVEECGLDCIQFHGGESPEFCERFLPIKVIKAFRIRDAASVLGLPAYRTDAWLLDSYVPDTLGGTGVQFNWALALNAKQHGVPVILAGGLTADNVASAVQEADPYAVDVSSGVESVPGRKDPAEMRRFVAAAKQQRNP